MTPSEQARADALADAETLRLNFHSAEVAVATIEGTLAADVCLNPSLAEIAKRDRGFAVRCAKRAARAAFLAVPGLRGDK